MYVRVLWSVEMRSVLFQVQLAVHEAMGMAKMIEFMGNNCWSRGDLRAEMHRGNANRSSMI